MMTTMMIKKMTMKIIWSLEKVLERKSYIGNIAAYWDPHRHFKREKSKIYLIFVFSIFISVTFR